MKLAVATSANRRDALRKKQRLDRIGAPMMRTRYPDLDTLQVEFKFRDRGDLVPSPQVTVLHPPAPAYFCFACPYSDCDGAFDLTDEIDVAVSARDPLARGQVRCAGSRHGTACTLSLDYSIAPHWM
jgi:hypothetical protein